MERIRVEGLTKIFGRRPRRAFALLEEGLSKEEILGKTGCTVGVNDASFSVEAGETFVVMGLSGSGKSTAIRCLNRLIEPTRGTVWIDGENILEMPRKQLLEARRSKLSMVFQHFGLLPHRTVLGNVEYGLEISGEEKKSRREHAMRALELVGLEGYEQSMPNELSGGMQQRVGLARALANDPEILLMDEAFSALDPLIRANMQDELLALQSRMQKTIVFITHDLDEALKLGDRVAIMKDGGIVQIGTPEGILTRPADDYVRAFVQNVDRTRVITASAIMRKAPVVAVPKDGPRSAIRLMEKRGVSSVYVVDRERRLLGILTVEDAVELERRKEHDVTPRVRREDVYVTGGETPISDLLGTALTAKYPLAIQDAEQKLVGILDRATIIAEAFEHDESGGAVPLSESVSGESGRAETEPAKETGDAS